MEPSENSANAQKMTARERSDLAKVIRARERVARTDAELRGAELLAEFEEQVARSYRFDDDATWREATAAAEEAAADANARIDSRCEQLGIPGPFRPRIQMFWYPRGENAAAERRAELRRVARTRIDALVKETKHTITRRSVETQELLVAGALTTDAARAFLEAIPSAEELMPPLRLADMEDQTALAARSRRGRRAP